MAAVLAASTMLHAQRGHLFPWVAVCFGVGVALFFTRGSEPSGMALWGVLAVALLFLGLSWRLGGSAAALLLSACASVAIGFAVAGWRAHEVAAPVLGWRYYGPVEGRVVAMDRSGSDAVRITLDQVRLGKISAGRTPERVRLSLHGDAADLPPPRPGAYVMTTGHLSPPSGPVEPGGFDFQRHAWFLSLGAVGYTRVPVLTAQPPGQGGLTLAIFRMRMAVSGYVKSALPGDVGGFAAAVTAGDRSGMTRDALTDLRASNLAHLLAISGLHMGLLTGFVFSALRIGLVLIPGVALRWNARAVAAFGALLAGAFYLALSGGNVATERAYIMAAVALCAVMLNRRAISLRSVAIAALIVMFLHPVALLGPGFQMSFAATTALVAVFNAIRFSPWRLPKWAQPVAAVFVSSGVAGFATAPFAAAHFNAFAHYGLAANVISVPVMGILVVPFAVLAALLAPFGLADWPLQVMGWGLRWILWVADTTANTPGARSFVVGPDASVLPLISLGALLVILWQGWARWIGFAPVIAAFVIWNGSHRPDILIADTGGIVGIMTGDGRALSKPRGAGFIAQNWLENDGDGSDQADAHARWEDIWPDQPAKGALAHVAGQQIRHVTGKKASAAEAGCNVGILISNADVGEVGQGCHLFDPDRLRHTGAVALWIADDGSFDTKTARQLAGDRMWSGWPDEPAPDQYVRINPTNFP